MNPFRGRLVTVAAAAVAVLALTGAAAHAGERSGSPVTVSARQGWQPAGLDLQAGQSFTVTYRSGTWTVGYPGLAYVGLEGYSNGADEEIYQGCKILPDQTYGRLLARTGTGQPFVVGHRGTFTAATTGGLEFRINDDDRCLGDNAGALQLTVAAATAGTPSTDPGLLRVICPDVDTSEGAWHCAQLMAAVVHSPECVAKLLTLGVTYVGLLIAVGSEECALIFGEGLAQLPALADCYRVYHDLRPCLGIRPRRPGEDLTGVSRSRTWRAQSPTAAVLGVAP